MSKKVPFTTVVKKTSLSFAAMLPMIFGVIGLVGIFQATVTPEMLTNLFTGDPLRDTVTGTIAGGVAVGNPVISYILGGELLHHGVSFYAVTAFMLAWVTLGIIQLPAEVSFFGMKFTVARNLLALAFTIIIAILTATSLQAIS